MWLCWQISAGTQNFHKWLLIHLPLFAGLLISIQKLNVHWNCLFISFLVLLEINDLNMKRLLTRSETGKWVLYILRILNYHSGIINFVFEVCPMELTTSFLNIFSPKEKKGVIHKNWNNVQLENFNRNKDLIFFLVWSFLLNLKVLANAYQSL